MAGNKRGIVKNSRLFWSLDDAQIDRLMEMCEEQSYDAGLRIFSAGDRAHNLYIVERGKVALEMEIRIGSRTMKQVVIDVIEDGEVFSWPALSDIPVNDNSAIATENTKLLSFNGERLRQLSGEDIDLCRKVMQELLKLVSDRLSNAKRTLAHVLSVTSHDLRAPLATIQSSLEAVIGGFAGAINSKQEELLSGGMQRVSDLVSMIDNLLDISYVEIRGVDFEKVNLSEVIESSIGDVAGIAQEKGIVLRNETPDKLPQILGIARRLRQVLTNLLGNAVKFTPSGGMATIGFSETTDKVQLEVADTGIGISAEELPKIFGDFYRGIRIEAEGAGLGLAIAKKIVEAHGGSIWAESPDPETGKGTRFSLALPKVFEPGKTPEDEGRQGLAGAKILVADDDPEMRRIVALVLESHSYEVRTAQDGEEALAKIKEEEPDLVILDLLMPRMDGFEVCKQLEEQRGQGGRRMPILILSAVREDSSRRRYELETEMDLDVDDYITKPISPPVLLQRVERALMKGKAIGATSLTITKGGKQWTDKPES